jgi:hypothetical protein
MLTYLVMTGETDRLMTDPELVYHMLLRWLALASNLHKIKKMLHSTNKMQYIDRGLACAELTFHKFRTGLTLLIKLPYNHCISILSFIYPPKSIEWRAWRATTSETRDITRADHIFVLICSCFVFCFFHYYFVQPRTFSKYISFRFLYILKLCCTWHMLRGLNSQVKTKRSRRHLVTCPIFLLAY